MAFYDIRDLLGHWVKPKSRAAEMCPHACCKGRRPHPERFPVILPRGLLHSASERDLLAHLDRYGGRGEKADEVARQVVRELDRREDRDRAARARRDRAKDRRATRDSEFRAHLESQYIAAEAQTRGEMLNRAGKAAGVDERSLFTGPESRVQKYASPELRRYFEDNPRVSRAEFLGGGEAQRQGARRRAEGNLLGISRSSSSSSARPTISRARGRVDGAVRAQYRTRVAADSRGFVVTKGGKELPGRYDSPRAAQGAMRKAVNAETRALKARTAAPRRPPRPITPYADLF